MCYTAGECKYEVGGAYCGVPNPGIKPDDAVCMRESVKHARRLEKMIREDEERCNYPKPLK